jgi:hypothetical protein
VIRRRRFHRIVFYLAGAYNIAWGVLSMMDPQWLFRFARMPTANYPEIFACLGMVVGLYGLLYWDVASAPERGCCIAAVGFIGKVLGPVGISILITSGRWPPRTIVLCLANDVLWWPVFALYLHDIWAYRITRHRREARGALE